MAPRDVHALTLPARELVRDSGRRRPAPRPTSSSTSFARARRAAAGQGRVERERLLDRGRTLSRGLSEAVGSWNTIWMSAPAPAQRLLRERGEILPVQEDAASGRLDEPEHTPRERGFAAARLPHQAQRLAGGTRSETPSTARTTRVPSATGRCEPRGKCIWRSSTTQRVHDEASTATQATRWSPSSDRHPEPCAAHSVRDQRAARGEAAAGRRRQQRRHRSRGSAPSPPPRSTRGIGAQESPRVGMGGSVEQRPHRRPSRRSGPRASPRRGRSVARPRRDRG